MPRVIQEVKPVKQSTFMELDDGSFSCMHYSTEILRVSKEGKINILKVPTVTSTRMVKRCLNYIFGANRYDWKTLKSKYGQLDPMGF